MIGLPDVEREASESLTAAESHLGDLESMGYVLTEARSILGQAQDLYALGRYVESKSRAELAVSTADEIVEDAVEAYVEIGRASEALSLARSDGRTEGLEEAEQSLETASALYGEGRYVEALTYASLAVQQANLATAPESNSLLYGGMLVLGVLVGGGYYYMKRIQVEASPRTPAESSEPREIDLDKLFWHHQDLRLEDKEVIRFLAESGGEAFAAEIRNRFDIPRSSAWRLIRRLVNNGVAEERKVGNQSVVRIKDEYLK